MKIAPFLSRKVTSWPTASSTVGLGEGFGLIVGLSRGGDTKSSPYYVKGIIPP